MLRVWDLKEPRCIGIEVGQDRAACSEGPMDGVLEVAVELLGRFIHDSERFILSQPFSGLVQW